MRSPIVRISAFLSRLDLGERAAIALAETMHADPLLIDEAAGRAEAKRRYLRVTGTLGVLRSGAEQGLVKRARVARTTQGDHYYSLLLMALLERGEPNGLSRSTGARTTWAEVQELARLADGSQGTE